MYFHMCMYISISISISISIFTHISISISIPTSILIFIHIFVYIYLHIYTYIYFYIYMFMHVETLMHIRTHFLFLRVRVLMHICTCAYLNILTAFQSRIEHWYWPLHMDPDHSLHELWKYLNVKNILVAHIILMLTFTYRS